MVHKTDTVTKKVTLRYHPSHFKHFLFTLESIHSLEYSPRLFVRPPFFSSNENQWGPLLNIRRFSVTETSFFYKMLCWRAFEE